MQKLQNAWDVQFSHYQSNIEQAKELLSVGAAPRDDAMDPARHAALTIVCLAILNLDEAMTRE